MTATQEAIIRIVKKLILGQDYRSEVTALINSEFLDYTISFFKKVVEAKLSSQPIDTDWYKAQMLSEALNPHDIATHAGLNLKTIRNIHGNARKATVIEVSKSHYDTLLALLEGLIRNQDEVDLSLTVKFRNVSVDLNISESLIVINALAVKRAAIRGSLWSSAGKQVEKPLMLTLCHLHQVPKQHLDQSHVPKRGGREVDFYLFDASGKPHRCEVKLMGRGNPESADAAFARDTDVLIADTLLDSVKANLSNKGILWVELRDAQRLSQFQNVLQSWAIPFTAPNESQLVLQVEKTIAELLSTNRETFTPPAIIFRESETPYDA